MGELSERIALVTGGASGIGRASSLALARAGADVALTYFTAADEARSAVAEIEKLGRRGLALEADMTDAATVERVVAETEEKLGPIDILFTNAGGILKRVRSVEATLELWEQVFAVNVTSTFLVCQAVLKRMEKRQASARSSPCRRSRPSRGRPRRHPLRGLERGDRDLYARACEGGRPQWHPRQRRRSGPHRRNAFP